MPRMLSIRRAIVTASEREEYFSELRRRKEHYERSNCRFWVFEETALTGAFIEFVESDDAASLSAAVSAAPTPVLDPARVYTEVELR